jgi:protein involved in sex pheromone biosynthesis
MRKTLAISMMLAAALGLAACDKKSEDKAQDAQAHSEQAQKDMAKAQDKVNDAAKENADAAKAQADANAEKAKEDGTAAPVAPAKP